MKRSLVIGFLFFVMLFQSGCQKPNQRTTNTNDPSRKAATVSDSPKPSRSGSEAANSILASIPDSKSENDKPAIITDIKNWNHPAKQVFEKYGFELIRVELHSQKTYPIFHIEPGEYGIALDDYSFLSELAEKNGYWDFLVLSSEGFIEVRCNKAKKRVAVTKSETETREYDTKYSAKEAEEKAIALVVSELDLKYSKKTGTYFGEDGEVVLMTFGFGDRGRYEVRVCPSHYPLSVYHYCYVDLAAETVDVE